MLTRCKAGMIIVTSRIFLRTTGAQYTLLGELAQRWAQLHGESKTWRDWKEIAEQKVDMPGAPAPRRPTTPAPNATISLAVSGPPNRPPTRPPTRVSPATSSSVYPSASGTHTIAHVPLMHDEFPDLGTGPGPKNMAQGRWGSPTGVSAVKYIALDKPSRPIGGVGLQPPPTTRFRQPTARNPLSPTMYSQDPFPSLSDHQGVKSAQGRWKNGSTATKLPDAR